MKPQSQELTDYLQCTAIIAWKTPAVIEQTQEVTASLTQDIAKARALFERVCDAIPHSSDIGTYVGSSSISRHAAACRFSLIAHPHRKAGATSVIKRSSCSRFHGGRKVGI